MTPATAKSEQVDSPVKAPVDNAHDAAWQALRGAYHLLTDRFEKELTDAGLPGLAWYDVLLMMERTGQPIRPKDMLCHVSVTKSGLTRLLDRMEKAGLIERSYCPSDRRGTFLSITDDGRDTLAKMRPVRERVFSENFTGVLRRDEAEEVTALLGQVRESTYASLSAECSCDEV